MRLILLLYMVLSLEYIYPQQSVVNANLNDISFSDSLHGCVVGSSGVILYSFDGGIKWLRSMNTPLISFSSVYFLDSLSGFTVGGTDFDNRILKTNDGGKTWSQISSTDRQAFQITFIDSAIGFIAGSQFVYKTTDKGLSWTARCSLSTYYNFFISMGFINNSVGWATTPHSLFRTTNGGDSWIAVDSSIYFTKRDTQFVVFIRESQFVSDSTGFLATIEGIVKTTNQGTTWVKKYDGTFYSIYFLNEQLGWAAGFGGSIIQTIDGGENWTLLSSSTKNDLYSIFFINRKRGWAAGAGTTILYTTDGGDNWRQSSTLTSVNKIDAVPNNFYLYQNYPNPFNPSTTINYSIPKPGLVTLKIYDILGNEVAVLVNEEKQAGTYNIKFNSGNFASGIYFYRLKEGNYFKTKKMVLLR